MTLVKRGKYWYGDDHVDIRGELTRYSDKFGYPADDFVDVRCPCGSDLFLLATDEDEGVALRTCAKCEAEHCMGDSEAYLDDAEPQKHECLCEGEELQISVGVHRYRNEDESLGDAVHWLYIGCRCPSCGLTGTYADWKNEFEDYRALLGNM